MKPGTLSLPVLYAGKLKFLAILKNYFLAGYLLHVITILSVFVARIFYQLVVFSVNHEHGFDLFLYGYMFLWLSTLPVFAQLDARSRYQNFKLLRDLLYRYGFHYKFLRAMRHSRCQRDAARLAAKEMHMETLLNKYYIRCGYRWYHLIPDFVFKNPLYLLTRHFWITTFFTRSYHAKFFKY